MKAARANPNRKAFVSSKDMVPIYYEWRCQNVDVIVFHNRKVYFKTHVSGGKRYFKKPND